MINYKYIRTGSNCIIWTRVSTKHQEENGASLDDQKTKCEEYARQRSLNIVGYYGGTHESAQTPGPMIKKMIQAVKKDSTIKYILVTEFDRFSRNAGQASNNSHRNFTAGYKKKEKEEKPFDFSSVVSGCGGRDSNSHRIAPTTPSK